MTQSFKKFLVLWFGQFVASIGHGLTTFSLGVYAFNLANRAMDSSLVMLCGFLPTVLLTVPAGVLADKYDRRLLMILGDGLSIIGLGIMLFAKTQGGLSLAVLLFGVTISAIFSSLMQPAFEATISDLLPEDEFTKASGMVQIANSARFLISPILAAFLLRSHDLELILAIDISTIIVTVLATGYVRKGLPMKERKEKTEFKKDLMEGWSVLRGNKGVFTLVLIATLLTFFLGFIQNLSSPYFLSFSTSDDLGKAMSISALGMLVSGIVVSMLAIKKNFVNLLALGLFCGGLFMIGYPATENFYIITLFGFLFFTTLPLINASLDYLVRTNIENKYQGRVFSFIGLISQMGFVFAYIFSGLWADSIFTPALQEDGVLASSVGKIIGTGPSRGIAFEIMLAGIFMAIVAVVLVRNKHVRALEKPSLKEVK